ncbi:rRNA maturation RNase YbeY [Chloroflexota bacterium]
MKLGIRIEEEYQARFEEKWLRGLVKRCLELHEFDSDVELSLLITSDEIVRELNQRYRGIDGTTDVLSFALTEEGPDSSAFITPPDGVLHLGEVVISYTQAARQAENAGHGIEQEIALLVVHGVLHLLGYDHDEPDRGREMRELEQEILGDAV